MIRLRASTAAVAATAIAGMLGLSLSRAPHPPARRQTPAASSGLTLASLPADGGTRLIVTSLRTGGAAADAGLRVGDAIVGIGAGMQGEHPSPLMVDQAIAHDGAGAVDLRIRRDGGLLTVRIRGGEEGRRTR